ncbi:amino acid abc transporter substrate-binding paat family [Leptolyngbya sp. Heron Island J]|uniref:transporter substrate-binding domain-containing protein n=1 Tax=Leptolyngbya sp. Heron Island J TaxID=1385935 RepID=UPI0003B93AFD|nr:transporter substrate-binding domain-containing protein [Leptolyngbya sp. Heron Island J]ESA36216.1 amino acid abc transporter substrate-binding paat family [Leptolyngbya sp. Heron Island J]
MWRLIGRYLLGISLLLGAQVTVPPIVASAELAEIESRGRLIIAVKDNRFPLGYRDVTGELNGFEIDIARRLALDLLGDETALELRPVSNLDRINEVVDGEVDIAIAAITVTAQRQRIASFSEPYYLDGTGFITTSPQINTLDELALSRLAVLADSSTLAHLRYRLPNATLVPVSSYQQAVTALDSGRVDAFAGDVSLLTGWQQQDSHYRLLDAIISVEPVAIAIPKGTQYNDLRRAINAAIRQWDDEGWLQDRATYWGLP